MQALQNNSDVTRITKLFFYYLEDSPRLSDINWDFFNSTVIR